MFDPVRTGVNGSACCEQATAAAFENNTCKPSRHVGFSMDVDQLGANKLDRECRRKPLGQASFHLLQGRRRRDLQEATQRRG
jgi:hypothetical protein